MVIEISTDSDVWLAVKSALRAAGLRYFLQEQLFSPNKTLFVEPRVEPEDGHLSHGFIVHDGGAKTHIQLTDEEALQAMPVVLQNKLAAKSSTSVLNASVCQSCGCKLDGQKLAKSCPCRCHVDGPR